jgi:hypothetical protein
VAPKKTMLTLVVTHASSSNLKTQFCGVSFQRSTADAQWTQRPWPADMVRRHGLAFDSSVIETCVPAQSGKSYEHKMQLLRQHEFQARRYLQFRAFSLRTRKLSPRRLKRWNGWLARTSA